MTPRPDRIPEHTASTTAVEFRAGLAVAIAGEPYDIEQSEAWQDGWRAGRPYRRTLAKKPASSSPWEVT